MKASGWVTGQLADTPTRGLPTRGLVNSRTGHLADWSTRGLDNSRTGQVPDWTTRGCHRRLCVLSFARPRVVQSSSWLVRELSSPQVDQSARCPVRELAIRELSSYLWLYLCIIHVYSCIVSVCSKYVMLLDSVVFAVAVVIMIVFRQNYQGRLKNTDLHWKQQCNAFQCVPGFL